MSPADDPAVIASGPTVPDPTTAAEAAAVLKRWPIVSPPAVATHLASPRGQDSQAIGFGLGAADGHRPRV
ncbi:MAG: hydroxypyruvate reductase [Rhodospirillaceae bacterium]|nr:MAG: hydroxypyruvate reductase [Rhodospirillaceae bacterium]